MTDKTYPYPDNPGSTHWQGCWRCVGHHNCAVAAVDKLREAIDKYLSQPQFNDSWNWGRQEIELFRAYRATAPSEEAKNEV